MVDAHCVLHQRTYAQFLAVYAAWAMLCTVIYVLQSMHMQICVGVQFHDVCFVPCIGQ